MPRFVPVSSRAAFAQSENEVLEFWQKADVFARSLEQRKGAKPYVFFEGPPTANGKPGIHHVLARAYKDLFPRYKQMDGYFVERKAGWDTHGLPVELEVEKKIKVSGKKQIEEFGVDKFNQLCRDSVKKYVDDWEFLTNRLGFWIDLQNAYHTYDGPYIESVWWSLRQLWDQDLLFQGYRVAPYCPRCQTSLSSHELSQGYKDDIPDPSIYVKFELENTSGKEKEFLLAWTTTPWTLPGNVALAVHPNEPYVKVRQNAVQPDEILILAKARLGILQGEYEVLEEFSGHQLVDKTYIPLFMDMPAEGKSNIVVPAPELVSMNDGTGIVHTAGAYGEADLELCQKHGIGLRHVVGLDGKFVEGQSRYRGKFVKSADQQIIDDLQSQGNLYHAETITHTYPFCWRCDTPLIYFALTSWFIRSTAVRDKLLANNSQVNWQPAHIRDGRMGRWLENIADWNLSRSRYWGTPLPIWQCGACDYKHCIGSAAEIGLTTTDDLHKPFIDDITLECEKCGGEMQRVPEVIDAWYDSGAMQFAQWHYPFENEAQFAQSHPADFICEAMDQTRGWFFSLLAISTLLFDKPAYKNVICLGLLVDKDGKKMSKSRGNILDPIKIFDQHGADAARWYFYSSVSAGNEYRFAPEAVQDVVRRFLLTLWNTYSFFVTYAEIDNFDPISTVLEVSKRPVLDRWCLARLAQTVTEVRRSLDGYDATTACRTIEGFVDDLSKWYVRRSRRRFWKTAAYDSDDDKASAYATLFTALDTVTKLIAPFMPFVSERMYRNLAGLEGDNPIVEGTVDSVHLTDYPAVDSSWADQNVIVEMARIRRLVEVGLAERDLAKVKIRQPLAQATILGAKFDAELEAIFADELNVKSIVYGNKLSDYEEVKLDTEITDELLLEGLVRELSRKVNDLRKKADLALDDRITLYVDADEDVKRAVEIHGSHLMNETLSNQLRQERGEVLTEWEGQLGGAKVWLGVAR